jgi:UDP-N-acetylmuramoylalanine--D-glutamate ligase
VTVVDGRRILVVGLGSSGQAAARLAAAEGAEVWATDRRPAGELTGDVLGLPVSRWELGGHPVSLLDGIDEIVVSPGVDPMIPLLSAARARSVPVATEVEFAWRRRRDAPLAAVTGSNGKSTVTVLVRDMLRAAGIDAVAGGNLGPPASELVLAGGWRAWVLEVSSFQTELLHELRPRAAVLLNLSQDHLERHADMAAYAAAKHRLLAYQSDDDVAVLNADDPLAAAAPGRARRRRFSVADPADAWLDGDRLVLDGEPLLTRDELRLEGLHNAANALAAALAAVALGASHDAIRGTLRGFEGLPHRHRVVARADGVVWVDDSKATNVGATIAGLAGYPSGAVHLILGGLAKGQDFAPLRAAAERAAARVYLIGRDADVVATALEGVAPIERCGTLEVAVASARAHARSGQWVLLAPACASFDQFAGYAERGDAFARLALEEAPCR